MTNQVPENIRKMDEHAMNVIRSSPRAKMTAEEVADALGVSAETILNAAEGGNLPFGFLCRNEKTGRRTIYVNRAIFFRWYTRYLMAPYEM